MTKGIIELDASFISTGNAVGKKEFEGPLGQFFDTHDIDDRFGKNTWEKAESGKSAANAKINVFIKCFNI